MHLPSDVMAETFAGRVRYCPPVSQFKYTPLWDRQTDGRTDAIPMLYANYRSVHSQSIINFTLLYTAIML